MFLVRSVDGIGRVGGFIRIHENCSIKRFAQRCTLHKRFVQLSTFYTRPVQFSTCYKRVCPDLYIAQEVSPGFWFYNRFVQKWLLEIHVDGQQLFLLHKKQECGKPICNVNVRSRLGSLEGRPQGCFDLGLGVRVGVPKIVNPGSCFEFCAKVASRSGFFSFSAR